MMLAESVWLRVLVVMLVVMIQDSGRIYGVFGNHLPSLVMRLELGRVVAEIEE